MIETINKCNHEILVPRAQIRHINNYQDIAEYSKKYNDLTAQWRLMRTKLGLKNQL